MQFHAIGISSTNFSDKKSLNRGLNHGGTKTRRCTGIIVYRSRFTVCSCLMIIRATVRGSSPLERPGEALNH